MGVHQAQTLTEQGTRLDQVTNLAVGSHRQCRQIIKQCQDCVAITKRSQGQFANNHRMHAYVGIGQQRHKPTVRPMEVIDPDRGVDQDQRAPRCRGAAVAWGSVPPSWASRRELSRAISASRPSLTSIDFSDRPVSSAAFWISSSSRLSVVRIMASSRINPSII
jgi:hypothetical protein